MKYSNYKLIHAESQELLEAKVNEKLEQGFVPVGNVNVIVDRFGNGYINTIAINKDFYQAVVLPIADK